MSISYRALRCGGLVLLALAAISSEHPAFADSNLRAELSVVADDVASLAVDLKCDSIELRNFQFFGSDSKLKSAGGAGIGQVLAEELQKRKIAVRKNSPLRLSCDYVDVIDSKSKLLAAQLKFEMTDADGKVLTTGSRGVFGDAALSSLFGETVNLQPKADYLARSEQMINSLDHPTVAVDGPRVSASKDAPYAVEVLVESDGQYVPRDASVADGQASVKLAADEFFAVRLHNASEYEAAVYLAIDGLPLFTFSEETRFSQVIVPAKSEMLVRGWFRSKDESIKFQPGVYPKSDALEDRPKANGPGVITAVFSACYADDQIPPEDEPFHAIVRSFSRSASASGEELLLTDRKADPKAAPPAEAEIPETIVAEAEVPKADPVKSPAESKSVNEDVALAEIPPPVHLPRFATSRCVSTNEITYFDGVRRNFGVVRTAVTVRFAK